LKKITIYTDGGCEGNPGPGGWAAVLLWNGKTKEVSGGDPATTNNRMELTAAIGGLSALKEACEIELFTDSEYLRKGITEWIQGWKAHGWKTRGKTPVKNADLWRTLDDARQGHQINWRWVKGHAGHEHNERCDVLAGEAIAEMRRQHRPEVLKALLGEFKRKSEAGTHSPALLSF